MRRDRLVNIERVAEILGVPEPTAINFIIGMKVPVYQFGVEKYSRRMLVFSSDIVKAVAAAERLPTLQLKKELLFDSRAREWTRYTRGLRR